MKKFIVVVITAFLSIQFLLPLMQVTIVQAEEPETEQPDDVEEPPFTSVETQNYMDSQSYKDFKLKIVENAPETFNADDGNNPLLGVKQDHFDEMYLGYMNRSNKNKGSFVVKESLPSKDDFVSDNVDGSGNLIIAEDDIIEDDITEDEGDIEKKIIGKESELKRIGGTSMLFNEDPELFSYKGQNVIGFVGEQRTRITDSLEKLSPEKNNLENQKKSMVEKLAINKGFSEQIKIENKDGTNSIETIGQVSRLNTDDLFFKDQPEYIFETALYYGKYKGGLDTVSRHKEKVSGIRLTVYKVNNEEKGYEPIGEPIVRKLGSSRNTDGKEFLKKLEYKNTMALTALTKGDYDKDGKDEVAVYVPDAGTRGPYIAFFEIVNGELQEKIWASTGETREILLEEIDLKFGMKWKDSGGTIHDGEKWQREYMPSVHLHTTQVANKDQLVISATMPRVGGDPYEGKNHDNILAIYDYQPINNTKSMEQVGGNFHLNSGDVRMQFAASTDGDIDGDGTKELVVIGYKEYGYDNNKKKYGTIHDTDLYIQVIKPTIEQPEKKVEKETGINQSIGFSYHNKNFNKISTKKVEKKALMPPVAMDMGVMDSNPDTANREFLFVNGTLARHNPDNKKDTVPEYSFEVLDELDTNRYEGTAELTYQSVYFARLVEDSMEEHIMVLHSNADVIRDNVTIHPSVLGVNNNKIAYKSVSNSYVNNKNEDNDGTFVTFRPINADRDTTYYKYVGKEAGWSKPTVLSIFPAAPMWEELDYKLAEQSVAYIPTVSYTISNGKGDGTDGKVSMGASVAYRGVAAVWNVAADAVLGWNENEMKTMSMTYEPSGISDGVLFFSTPKTIYKYKRFMPRKIVTKEFLNSSEYQFSERNNLKEGDVIKGFVSNVETEINGTPILAKSSVTEFNHNAGKANNNLDEKDKIQLIDMKKITEQVEGRHNKLGHPFSFPEKITDLKNLEEKENLFALNKNTIKQTISTSGKLNASLALDESSSMSEGFALSFGAGFHGGMKKIFDLTVQANYSGGASWTQTSTHGETFAYAVPIFPTQDFPGIDIDESAYNFAVTPAMFRTNAYKNKSLDDMDPTTKEEMKDMGLDPKDSISPLVLTHLVESPVEDQSARDRRLPPALPKNLRLANRQYQEEVVGSGENAKTKTRVLATIAWDLPNYLPEGSETISEDRFPSYYQVYSRVDGNAWSLLTDDNSVPLKIPGTQNFATFYIEDQTDSREYKLQSVYHGKDNVRLESVTTSAFAVNGLNLDYDPIFTQQPRDFWASEETTLQTDEVKKTLHFSAKFDIFDSKKFVCEWQRFTENGEWEPVTEGETVIDSSDGTVSLHLQEVPEKVTHYQLHVKSNDVYENTSNIVNYYPADSQSVKLNVDVLNTDSMRVTKTENENKIHYQAGLVTAEEDGKVIIQTKVTDKDNTRVTSGTVYLRVNGDVKKTVDLTDKVANEKQGIAEFELSLKENESVNVDVEYRENGPEPRIGHYPVFTIQRGNVEDAQRLINLEYPEETKYFLDRLQVLSKVDSVRKLSLLEKIGYHFNGWRIIGEGIAAHEPLKEISYETIKDLLPQNRQLEALDVSLEPVLSPQQFDVNYHNLDANVTFDGKQFLQGRQGISLNQPNRLGYEFDGWYKDAELTQLATDKYYEPVRDLSFYAKWTEKMYAIRFVDQNFREVRKPLTYQLKDVFNGGVSLGQDYFTNNGMQTVVSSLTPDYYGDLVLFANTEEDEVEEDQENQPQDKEDPTDSTDTENEKIDSGSATADKDSKPSGKLPQTGETLSQWILLGLLLVALSILIKRYYDKSKDKHV